MSTYSTPGVYVEEISTLPPSVAQVATAIPAFIGYTKDGPINKPTRITSMLEYESIFGGPRMAEFSVTIKTNTDTGISTINAPVRTSGDDFILYHCMKLFFANGGGGCYVVSVGTYEDLAGTVVTKSKESFSSGLEHISKVDEPTLLLLTDAVNLDSVDYYTLCEEALAQCAKLKDRFTIMDVPDGEDITAFRNNIKSDLSYGAAYTPYLSSSYSYPYEESAVIVDEI